MIIPGIAKVMNDNDVDAVIDAAISILEKTGVQVENSFLLDILSSNGAVVDKNNQRARFPRKVTENMLETSEKFSKPADIHPSITSHVGIYHGYYLDPLDDQNKPWTQERLLQYVSIANQLPHIDSVSLLGYPAVQTGDIRQPLFEKWFSWKYGIHGGQSIWVTDLCPAIHEIWQIYADWQKKDIKTLFNGTVYIISPLRFGKEEAEHFVYFYEKGLRVYIGWMGTLGTTLPVTLDGALALNLAEGLFVNMFNRFCYGVKKLELHTAIAVTDMRTCVFQYGRPEQTLLNTAGAQIAERLGASYNGHTGLSDAKEPGYESAGQKVYSALSGALTYGSGDIAAGLLSVDEVYSPVQMILDDEMTGAIKQTLKNISVSRETLAIEEIDEVGPGGMFMNHEHTAEHFRDVLWLPQLWSRESFGIWREEGNKNAINRALEKYRALLENIVEPVMPEKVERELLKVIEQQNMR